MVRVVSGLIVLVALARAASAEEMVRRADTSGRFSVEVPAAWRMQPTEQEVAALNLAGELAGGKRVFVSVYHLGAQDALAQAWHDRDAWARDERTTRVEVIPGPPPVIHWSYGEGDNRLFEAAQYSVVRRNCIRVHLVCPPDVWPQVQDRLRPIVDSLKAEIDEWPPHPPGFERSEKDGYVWLVQDGVSARELRDLQKLARETERRFAKVHGKLRLDPENPPFLMVCADAAYPLIILVPNTPVSLRL